MRFLPACSQGSIRFKVALNGWRGTGCETGLEAKSDVPPPTCRMVVAGPCQVAGCLQNKMVDAALQHSCLQENSIQTWMGMGR